MVVKALHAAAALLAVVRPHLPARPADNADLLEITLLDQLDVLRAPLVQQRCCALPPEHLARRPRPLAELEGRPLELRLLGDRGHPRIYPEVHGVHERLQLRAARAG